MQFQMKCFQCIYLNKCIFSFRDKFIKLFFMMTLICAEILDSILNTITSDFSADSLELHGDDDGEEFPLPCSEDFEFFMNIAKTVPPHSPGSQVRPFSFALLNSFY